MNRPLPNPADDLHVENLASADACGPRPELSRVPHSSGSDGDDEDQAGRIVDVLRHGQRFLVTSHCRPDGDAVGSVLAMGMLLEQMGKSVDLVSADPIPAVYRGLPDAGSIRSSASIHGAYDAAILLECDGVERACLAGLEDKFLINIDHHLTGRAYGNINWIDRTAASVGEMVYRLVKAAGCQLTHEMAICLYTTLLTDTGGFCYGSTRPSTFAIAHELTLAGADPLRIAQDIYYSTSMARMLLLGAALTNLKREGHIAWLWITHDDMLRADAVEEDCEGIVNYAICIAGIEAAAFLRELPERRIRLSLRSKGHLNMAAVAARLGGGGHENAAGCTLDGPLRSATDQIVAELRLLLAPETPQLFERTLTNGIC